MNQISKHSILVTSAIVSHYTISLTHYMLWGWRKKETKLEQGRERVGGFPLQQGKHK